ncbi:MAG: hypothetical protein HFI93_10920 [Lachnospiraceae bacterium]|nr:hypothetical protein [Lachnospiraceae bacterium]
MKRTKGMLLAGGLLVLLLGGCSAAGAARTEAGNGREKKAVSSETEEGKIREEGKACKETKGWKETVEAEEVGQDGIRTGTRSLLASVKGIRKALTGTDGAFQAPGQQAEGLKTGDAQAEEPPLSAEGVAGKEEVSVSRSGKGTQRPGTAAKETLAGAGTTPVKEVSGTESPAPVPKEESASAPEETPAPASEEMPRSTESAVKPPKETPAAETPAPAPSEPAEVPEETVLKGPYDYVFDIDAIQADGIAAGRSMGYAWDASLTPDNASWWNPVTASESHQGAALKQSLESYIRFHTAGNLASYGMEAVTAFHIYCEPRGNGVYSIYFLFV